MGLKLLLLSQVVIFKKKASCHVFSEVFSRELAKLLFKTSVEIALWTQ